MAGAAPVNIEKAGLDYTSTDQAKSGDIKNGPIFNISSVGSIGTVKLLAIGGLAWLLLQFFKKK